MSKCAGRFQPCRLGSGASPSVALLLLLGNVGDGGQPADSADMLQEFAREAQDEEELLC